MTRLRLGMLTSHPIQYQAPLFRELSKHHDVVVYFAHQQTPQGQAAAGFGVAFDWDVDLFSGYEHRFLNNIARKPGVDSLLGCNTPSIASEIRDGCFDAFLVSGWYLRSYWQAVRACSRYHVPVMVRGDSQLATVRSRWRQWIKSLVYPHLLRQFDACLYVGLNNRAYLEHYGVPAEKLFFSPHCIDNEEFSVAARRIDRTAARAKHGIEAGVVVILFVGKLIERKRPLDIIHALSHLAGQGLAVKAMFAGDGPLRDALECAGRKLNVPTVFLGFCNQTELPEVYAMADILVLPSDSSETWGLVVNEALACGVPVVTSDLVGCSPDLVRAQSTGAVYRFGDVIALSEALSAVIENPPTPKAIRSLSECYSVRAAADGVIQAARHLCKGRTGA